MSAPAFAYLTSGFKASDYNPFNWGGCVMARGSGWDSDRRSADSQQHPKWDAFLWPDDSNNNWKGRNTSAPATPNRYCPVELLPLTSDKSDIEDKIDEMYSDGNTHINVGLVWGWRVLSPTAPFTEGHAYDDEDYNKAIVLMTDGENVMSSTRLHGLRLLESQAISGPPTRNRTPSTNSTPDDDGLQQHQGRRHHHLYHHVPGQLELGARSDARLRQRTG